MKHCRLQQTLLLTVLSFLLLGCQNLTNQNSENMSSVEESNDTVAKRDVLVPTDPNLDLAEAEFEKSILAQTKVKQVSSELNAPKQPRELVWDELADQFQMIEQYHDQYQDYLAFYVNNAKHLERVSVRARPYLHFIMEEVRNRNMPYEIALLPIIESAFYPYAHSRMRAAGLWQFIPSTGRIYGLKQDWWYDGRQDVYYSTHAALDFLQSLYELNNQDWLLALASYNAGYGRIQQARNRLLKAKPGSEINYWTVRPYLPRETRHYVPQLLAVSYLIKHREKYEITVQDIPNEPYLTMIEIDRQLDLNKAAKLADLPLELMKHLNPGYLKTVTPPDGPHHLLIPLTHKDAFEQQLADNSGLFDIRWQRHQIREGDTLGTIAQSYRTSIPEIRRLNNLSGNVIRAGRTLLIPIPAQHANEVTQLAKANNAAAAKKTNNKNEPSRAHYVQRGESLWTIANYYNIETTELAAWNNLNPRTPIQVGQRLEIRSSKYGHTVQHKVANGESLWLIAQRYNVSVQDISRWNNLRTSATLRPGTELTIWRSGAPNQYTVRQGDTLWDIAKSFNINSKRLQDYNKISQNEHLKPGQVIRIPNDS